MDLNGVLFAAMLDAPARLPASPLERKNGLRKPCGFSLAHDQGLDFFCRCVGCYHLTEEKSTVAGGIPGRHPAFQVDHTAGQPGNADYACPFLN